MATTAIFAEILIVGLQATIWIGLVLAGVIDLQVGDLSSLNGWENLITVMVLASAYALGIVVDRLADSVFDPFDRRIRDKSLADKQPLPEVHYMRLEVMAQEDGKARFLDYVRSRVRVARATAFNLALIIVALLFFIGNRPEAFVGIRARQTADFVILVGLTLLAIAVFAWRRITKTYYWRLAQAYQILHGLQPDSSDQPKPAADDPA